MRKIVLIRHATAKDGADDFKRELEPYGEIEALDTAKKLKAKNLVPDILLHSPASRTSKTAEIISKEFSLANELIIPYQELYLASSNKIVEIINEQHKDFKTIFLVAHNPGLSYAASSLLGGKFINLAPAQFVVV